MSLPVRLHHLAEQDLLSAWLWYEEQHQGLGSRFLAAVEATIEHAAQWPHTGNPAMRNTSGEIVERRIATAGFPYVVRYRTIGQMVVIMAVYHQHRRPDFATDRSP